MVFDSDAHVEENAETFSALLEKEEFAKSRPRIIEGETRAFWLIEGKVFPKLTGKGVFTFGTPHGPSEGEHADLARKTPRGSQEMTDPAARLKTMDEEGIDVSVVFPTLFLTYPVAEGPVLLRSVCRTYNEWIASRCSMTGKRIRWIATLPLPEVEASVDELEHAKELGTSGLLILGTAGNLLLDDPKLDPLYRRAEQLNIPVCVHVGWAYPPLTALYDKIGRAHV